ncbi:MAG TPA: substrate-binding domain-containing protein [Solirubrobacteraceae bacterium]|jgi:ABC-type phosphate transport system substrate-binding protein|nr:substrate-binding domain-containing protein [Solirubrobacteraceae bacterium]
MRLFSALQLAAVGAVSVLAATVLAVPGTAGASLGTQCSGANVTGQGANALKNAHAVWDTDFNTSSSKLACAGLKSQGSGGKPTVAYTTSSAATGLESWGANGHLATNFSLSNAFIGASEPPNLTQKGEIESHESTATANTLLSIPTVQTAIAVIVNLPTGCVATSAKDAGRLELNNVTLEGIFRGTITKWSEIKDDGDTLSGAGCNAETAIIPVVRLDGAGTTHIFKKYLSLINSNTFIDEKENTQSWNGTSEGTLNTDWPKGANVVRPAKTGDTAIDTKVAETPGSISYTTFAEARANGSFSPSPGTGGPGTARFWVPIENTGLETSGKKIKYADPSSNGDSATVANANCAKEEYTNGEVAFPPSSAQNAWDEVTTRTTEKAYPLCSIIVELAFTKYSLYSGTSVEEATTVGNFLSWVVNAKSGAGQKSVEGHDYLPLPKGKVLEEAQKGAALIGF